VLGRRVLGRQILGALVLGGPLACGGSSEPPRPPAVVEEFPAQPAVPETTLPLAPVPPILMRDVGFAAPQSALYDPRGDVYLISNIGGGPADADNDGFISKVGPDGVVIELRWIDAAREGTTLNAPKGMALIGETLFVADIDTVRGFDRGSGKPLGDVAIAGASFLTDVAVGPAATLYVSDTGLAKANGSASPAANGADAIYVIDAQRNVKTLARGPELMQPSGLAADKQRLLVAAASGEIYSVDAKGQRAPFGKPPTGGLNGLLITPGQRLLVSSGAGSAVYISKASVAGAGEFEPLIGDLHSPADLGYDPKRRQLIVPLLEENALYIQELPGDVN
jgi:DNA-binding beta-propeller fold protein YncE